MVNTLINPSIQAKSACSTRPPKFAVYMLTSFLEVPEHASIPSLASGMQLAGTP